MGTVLDGNDGGNVGGGGGVCGWVVWAEKSCVWGSRMFAGWVYPAKRGQMPYGIWWINGWKVSVDKMSGERLARAMVEN